jgi:18S rRNA (adenine1779-N6/adenine1780-N6)-dimethyltransferase
MFQEEFALRLSAKPGDELYCRLSVNTQLLARVEQLMRVGRNNFKPPPKVESRVVRIVLHNPPPPVDFMEWDGLVRLAFNRKNKTMRSNLTTSTVLALLESNARTVASLRGSPLPSEWSAKGLVEEVLTATGYGAKRSSKLAIDDYLALLAAFNQKGLHFAC